MIPLCIAVTTLKTASLNLHRYLNNLHQSHLPPSATTFFSGTIANGTKGEGVTKSKTAVLIFFGVPKHFRLVFTSYMKNIVQRNPRMKFEVSVHMCSDLHLTSYENDRSNEKNAMLDSPDVIQTILDEVGGDHITSHLTTSSQKLFMDPQLSWIQQSDLSFFWTVPFRTLLNQFRQGISLREAFFSYQKRNNDSWNDDHHVYIFARSDVFLMSPVDIPSKIDSVDVLVPSWQNWQGYNDRFAIAGPNAAKVYATKGEGYKEAILARRSNPAQKLFTNAETLLKLWLLKNNLTVTEHEDKKAWALLRVRADGQIDDQDSKEFTNGNVTLVEQLPHYLEW